MLLDGSVHSLIRMNRAILPFPPTIRDQNLDFLSGPAQNSSEEADCKAMQAV